MIICTIGTRGKTAEDFFETLKTAGVQKVIDIRRQNDSHLLGFTRKCHLAYLCEAGFAIAYEHIPEFAPSVTLLRWYQSQIRKGKWDHSIWDKYVDTYNREVLAQPICEHFKCATEDFEVVCLLCSEETADHCHRRLLAEHLRDQIEGAKIRHL